MSNMSYCRFRNTLADIRDCLDAVTDLCSKAELSPEEREAAEELAELGEKFGQYWNQVEEGDDDADD